MHGVCDSLLRQRACAMFLQFVVAAYARSQEGKFGMLPEMPCMDSQCTAMQCAAGAQVSHASRSACFTPSMPHF